VFVKECISLGPDVDIMSVRGYYHKNRVEELTERFKTWRSERVPGVRAFQSNYDRWVILACPASQGTHVADTFLHSRVGIAVCKWLYQSIHDLHAASSFDYILPLMVRFCGILSTEVINAV
jgi:proteasome activator subunit 4